MTSKEEKLKTYTVSLIVEGRIIPNEKDLMFQLVRQQKNCEFSLRFILQKEEDLWNNCFTMLELVKKGTRNESDHDYGELVVGERLLNIQDGLQVISALYEKNGKKGRLMIPDYDEFVIASKHQLTFTASKQRYGMVKSNWGMRFCEFNVEQNRAGRGSRRDLLKEGFPYYPDVGEAVMDFFGLATEYFSSYGGVYLVIPDYRARIDSLKLLFSKAELKVHSTEIKHKDLLLKVFAKNWCQNKHHARHSSRIRISRV